MLTICRTRERQMPEALNNKPGNPRNERRNENKAHKFESEGLERLGGEDSLPGTNRFLACQSPSFSLVTIVKLFGKWTPLWHCSGAYQEERGGFTVVRDARFKVHFPYLQQDEPLGKTIKWNGAHRVSFSFFWRIPGHKKEWEVLIGLSGSTLFFPVCSKSVRSTVFSVHFLHCSSVPSFPGNGFWRSQRAISFLGAHGSQEWICFSHHVVSMVLSKLPGLS